LRGQASLVQQLLKTRKTGATIEREIDAHQQKADLRQE